MCYDDSNGDGDDGGDSVDLGIDATTSNHLARPNTMRTFAQCTNCWLTPECREYIWKRLFRRRVAIACV